MPEEASSEATAKPAARAAMEATEATAAAAAAAAAAAGRWRPAAAADCRLTAGVAIATNAMLISWWYWEPPGKSAPEKNERLCSNQSEIGVPKLGVIHAVNRRAAHKPGSVHP